MFSAEETQNILDDAQRIGASIGWSDRGVSLPTQDVLVQNLSKESQECVHRAIREQLLPFARRHYPHLNAAFDKQPYPRPGNLFIVRYQSTSARPGGRGLKLHKDETALTFNLCLSPLDGFTGGGTYFPAMSADVDGILLRPNPGCCLIHDGNIKHAGNEVVSGQRFILVGFYNADGRDRAGEEQYFSKKALEEQRARGKVPVPQTAQTIYFTTAVPSARGNSPVLGAPSSTGGCAVGPTSPQDAVVPTVESEAAPEAADVRPPMGASSVAIQGPIGTGAGDPVPLSTAQSAGTAGFAGPSSTHFTPISALNGLGAGEVGSSARDRPEEAAGTNRDRPLQLSDYSDAGAGGGSSTMPRDWESQAARSRRHKQQPNGQVSRFPAQARPDEQQGSQQGRDGRNGVATCMPGWSVLQMLHGRSRPHLPKGGH